MNLAHKFSCADFWKAFGFHAHLNEHSPHDLPTSRPRHSQICASFWAGHVVLCTAESSLLPSALFSSIYCMQMKRLRLHLHKIIFQKILRPKIWNWTWIFSSELGNKKRTVVVVICCSVTRVISQKQLCPKLFCHIVQCKCAVLCNVTL